MTTVNYGNPKTDTTVKVFDRFYVFEQDVPVDQYDAVLSYFNRVFKDLLAEIQCQDQLQLSSTLCYYLNNQRSNATLLGINALVTPNFYAARNVLP